MKINAKPLRAIDLYSGIGGWSLGLKMAGVDVVASYEWWNEANNTNRANNCHSATETNIRLLKLSDLPPKIDIVVGSPPCTQFSYANRGGSGDIIDGLKDIAKFLEVVAYLKPRFWAMENVPRVAKVIPQLFKRGGLLAKYAELNPTIKVLDMSEWGVPQSRKRCIVGNFDFKLLDSYKNYVHPRTLGDVVDALRARQIVDPVYGINELADYVTDHEIEAVLSWEEERMNRDLKTFHPVYNNMAFPEHMNRAARTVTATCTRVSRESLIIAAHETPGRFRRLTVRERGCVQSFPINYQFFGTTYSKKIKMIGNAIPPLFTYYIAHTMRETSSDNIPTPNCAIKKFICTKLRPKITTPEDVGSSYQFDRTFRAAIPNLRLKSGVRFELSNCTTEKSINWKTRFFFGNSKDTREIDLDEKLLKFLGKKKYIAAILDDPKLLKICNLVSSHSPLDLQNAWSHQNKTGLHPYVLVDEIGLAASEIKEALESNGPSNIGVIDEILSKMKAPPGSNKMRKHATSIVSGMILCASVNQHLRSISLTGNTDKYSRF